MTIDFSNPAHVDMSDGDCTCADILQQAQSNKKYKLVVFAALAIVGLILIFDNPGAYGH